MPTCNTCGFFVENYPALAEHILKPENKSSHSQGFKWALQFKTKLVLFKPADQSRIPLTEQEKQNKEDSQRVLSGEMSTTQTLCPTCRKLGIQVLPTEYVKSPMAWRKDSRLVVNCAGCRK